MPADKGHLMHHQRDEKGVSDMRQLYRVVVTMEKETAIVRMSQKAWLAQMGNHVMDMTF
jgi:hypothetical protein